MTSFIDNYPIAGLPSFCGFAIHSATAASLSANSCIKKHLITLVASIALPVLGSLDFFLGLIVIGFRIYQRRLSLTDFTILVRSICVIILAPVFIFLNIMGMNRMLPTIDVTDNISLGTTNLDWFITNRRERIEYLKKIKTALNGYKRENKEIDDLIKLRNAPYWDTIGPHHLTPQEHLAMDLAINRSNEPLVRHVLKLTPLKLTTQELNDIAKTTFLHLYRGMYSSPHYYKWAGEFLSEKLVTLKRETLFFIVNHLSTFRDEGIESFLTISDANEDCSTCHSCLAKTYCLLLYYLHIGDISAFDNVTKSLRVMHGHLKIDGQNVFNELIPNLPAPEEIQELAEFGQKKLTEHLKLIAQRKERLVTSLPPDYFPKALAEIMTSYC